MPYRLFFNQQSNRAAVRVLRLSISHSGFVGDPSAPLDVAEIGFLVLKTMRSIKKTVILNLCERSTVIPLRPSVNQLIDSSSLRSVGKAVTMKRVKIRLS